jgi:DNA-binding transcriptional LysR family regulator
MMEVFQSIARCGTVQEASDETGLSVSTVSHHLRSLEEHLDTAMVDHKNGPMMLTSAGSEFLHNIEDALRLIREAEIEAISGNIREVRSLHLGLLEDFDSEIAPDLAQVLATGMKNCEFHNYTRPSHEMLNLLRSSKIDIGVATKPVDDVLDLVEYPILRDPFVLAIPAGHQKNPGDYLSENNDLPQLRYSHNQIIGRQIKAQLQRLRISPSSRFEMESNQSIMRMVAKAADGQSPHR